MLDIVKAKQAIENADVVSFDIFDTLIRRKLDSPKDVFNLMKGAASQAIENLNRLVDAPAFAGLIMEG